MSETNSDTDFKEHRIDFIGILRNLWGQRILIVRFVLAFIVLGVLVSIITPVSYNSTVQVLPENASRPAPTGFGGLARQFGVSTMSQNQEGIPVDLYPNIIRSRTFLHQLLNFEVQDSYGESKTIAFHLADYQANEIYYVIDRFTVNLPNTILRGFRRMLSTDSDSENITTSSNQDRVSFTKREYELIDQLNNRISVNRSDLTGLVSISVTMHDPVLATDIATQIVEQLTEYIVNYRTAKVRNDVSFIEHRHHDAKVRYEVAQAALATFRDENRGNLTAIARTNEQRLLSEYNLTFNLFNTLSEQLEQARIKLQEETPVVSVLEPAIVPVNRSAPKRTRTVLTYIILGIIAGLSWVIIKPGVQQLIQEIKKQEYNHL